MAVAQGEENKGEAAARSSAASRLAARRAAKAAAKAAKRGTAPIMPSQISKGVRAAQSWYTSHQRALWLGVGACVLGVIAAFVIASQLDRSAHKATELLDGALATTTAPVIAPGSEPEGPAPEESYASADARARKARAEFSNVVKRYPSTPAALWSSLGEADALLELHKPADAQKLYAGLVAHKGLDPFLEWRALEGLGFALEAQGKYADAQQRFERIAGLQHGAYKAVSDYHVARMEIAQGQKQKAADRLQAMVKAERARPPGEGVRFEDIVTDAETLLAELSVELDAPKLRVDLPAAVGAGSASTEQGPGASAQKPVLTKQIVDALRKQLAQGKGGKGLTKEIVDQLEKQVESGHTNATTTRVPVPAPAAPAKPEDKPQ